MKKIERACRNGNGFIRTACVIVIAGAVWTYQIAQAMGG